MESKDLNLIVVLGAGESGVGAALLALKKGKLYGALGDTQVNIGNFDQNST